MSEWDTWGDEEKEEGDPLATVSTAAVPPIGVNLEAESSSDGSGEDSGVECKNKNAEQQEEKQEEEEEEDWEGAGGGVGIKDGRSEHATDTAMSDEETQGADAGGEEAELADEGGGDGGGWWGSWSGIVDTVKKTTEMVVEIYKEDLAEFSSTISTDTKDAVEQQVKPMVEQAISKQIDESKRPDASVTSQMTASLASALGLHTDNGPNKKQTEIILDQFEAQVRALQTELSTFCTVPKERGEFELWSQSFDVRTKTDEISQLLTSNEEIRGLHTKLVPAAVSYGDFWKRYYFRLEKVRESAQRRAALLQRAEAVAGAEEEDEDLGWDLDLDELDELEGGDGTSDVGDTDGESSTYETEVDVSLADSILEEAFGESFSASPPATPSKTAGSSSSSSYSAATPTTTIPSTPTTPNLSFSSSTQADSTLAPPLSSSSPPRSPSLLGGSGEKNWEALNETGTSTSGSGDDDIVEERRESLLDNIGAVDEGGGDWDTWE